MSESADKLNRSRLAIIEHIHRKERRNEGPARPGANSAAQGSQDKGAALPPGNSWLNRLRRGFLTWWRYHPAHLAVELATPIVSTYARSKPLQFLGIAAVAGAVVLSARPWKLISITGLLVALLKSTQLSSWVMSALSAADYQKDGTAPVGNGSQRMW